MKKYAIEKQYKGREDFKWSFIYPVSFKKRQEAEEYLSKLFEEAKEQEHDAELVKETNITKKGKCDTRIVWFFDYTEETVTGIVEN